MEPLSLIATLVLTKALEKSGEKLGERVIELGGELMEKLQRKSPDTASAIQKVAENPQLAEQKPENYGIPILEAQIVEAAKSDTEIAAAVQALADAVKSQPQTVQKINKIAETVEKIGNVNQDTTIQNQTFNQTF